MPHPHLSNADLKPTTLEQRTWSQWHIAALWVSMAVCIPTYMLAGQLMQKGSSLADAVLAIAIGNLVVLVPLTLNAHPGTKYGIPFPVLLRASFGVLGANVPAMMRAAVACGWFGINTYFGGVAVYQIVTLCFPHYWALPEVLPAWFGMSTGMLFCYLLFWGVQVAVIARGMASVRTLEMVAAPVLIAVGIGLFVWAWLKSGSLGLMLGRGIAEQTGTATALAAGVNGAVAFWGTLALNIPDFARYARSQRDQLIGQAISLPPTMTVFAFIGAAVTNATVIIFGTTIANPVDLVAKIGGPFVVVFSMLALALATLSTNLAANMVSPANDISNLAPHKIGFRKGAVMAALVSFVFFPWKLAADVINWLSAYGVMLGAVGGIMIVDYYLIRKRVLMVDALYERGGCYEYKGGVNRIALVALGLGVGINVPGMMQKLDLVTTNSLFLRLYEWGWFVAFFVAGITYFCFTQLLSRPPTEE